MTTEERRRRYERLPALTRRHAAGPSRRFLPLRRFLGRAPLVTGAAAIVLFAATACSALEPPSGPAPFTLIVNASDVSGSVDAKTRCPELSARLRPLVEDRRTRRLDVLALATGEGATGEPRVLVPWTTYVPAAGLYETPGAAARHRAEWIAGVERVCRENLRPSGASPVYEVVERALQAIAARCDEAARERRRCERKILAVHSDLRSTHGAFGARLRALAARKPPKKDAKFFRLPVDGIETSFCGVSNTSAGDGLPAEVVLAAWSEAIGRPLVFDPTCAVSPAAPRSVL